MTNANAQQSSFEKVTALQEREVKEYVPELTSGQYVYLEMDYGSFSVSNRNEARKLSGAKIARIDLVYSDYPQGVAYPNLTKKRLQKLKELNPSLFTNTEIQWQLVRQTNCSDKRSAQKLFHGFVVTYRPQQTMESMSKEIAFLDSIFNKSVDLEEDAKSWTFSEKFVIDPITKQKKIISRSDTIFLDKGIERVGFIPNYRSRDSVVHVALERNKWTNMAIVADLTGSMSPYSAQLLIWFKLNANNDFVKHFIFFNDGDKTPNNKKVIGKTGGIYDMKTSKFEDVENLARTTMKNGFGGDAPENDVEALIKAIEVCPTCEDIVLIADNWAPIKDISLLTQISKPIKVILCGSDYGINTEYLDLARATGGSVHTIEEDLTQLMHLNEGQEITIEGQSFKILKGKFIKISKV